MKQELPEGWERQADLHYAYQHGVDAARGDAKAVAEFKQKFIADAQADAEYQRGVNDESSTQNGAIRGYWTKQAEKLQAELVAAEIEQSATDDVIAANAGGWFAAMSANEKSAVIATMRSLSST